MQAGSRRMECSRRVIAVSLECIKTLIVKLDKEVDLGCDGVKYVMSQFSLSEAADNVLVATYPMCEEGPVQKFPKTNQ